MAVYTRVFKGYFGLLLITILVLVTQVSFASDMMYFSFEKSFDSFVPRGDGVKLELVGGIGQRAGTVLEISNRSSNWHGAQVDLRSVVEQGKTYKFEAFVYQDSGKDEELIMTIQRTYKGESTGWDRVKAVVVPSGQWTKMEGEYTVRSEANEFIFYFEATNPTLSFFVDDLRIYESGSSVSEQAVQTQQSGINLIYGFENGYDIASAFGKAKLFSSSKLSSEGKTCLEVSQREDVWSGVSFDLSHYVNALNRKAIDVSVDLYHNSLDPQPFIVIVKTKDVDGEAFSQLLTCVVMPNVWKRITFSYTPTLARPEGLQFIIVSPFEKDLGFYVDNLKVSTSQSAQTGVVVKEFDFENGILGWEPRGDDVEVSISQDTSTSGMNSLHILNRTQNWHGTQTDLRDALRPDKAYYFEGWVYQKTGQDQTIIMTMQRKYGSDNATSYDWIQAQTIPTDQWTKISGTYAIKANERIDELLLYFEAQNPYIDFYIDDVSIIDLSVPKSVPESEIPSLKDVFNGMFKIGVAIPAKVLENSLDKQLVVKHFNSITAENEMKPESILRIDENGNITYDFRQADEFIEFAQENGISVRGHTLIWHSQTPDWFFKDKSGNLLNREQMINRMRDYIHTVVGHFKGKVYAWDVVNEAIDPLQSDGFRRSLWYQIIGPEYIELAFEFAHEADPDALLFYNDYNTFEQKKRDFIYTLLSELKAKNVPIDGIGMQQHINLSTSIDDIEEAIILYSNIPGLQIHVTELDISVYKDQVSSYQTVPYEALVEQAEKYGKVFNLYKKYSNVVTSVTLWGLKDDYSWLNGRRNDWPLLFDKDYQAKFSFWKIADSNIKIVAPKRAEAARGSALVIAAIMDDTYSLSTPIRVKADDKDKAVVWTIWDDDYIYVYADIYDTTDEFDKDGVALYIASNNIHVPYAPSNLVKIFLGKNGNISVNRRDVEVAGYVSTQYKKYAVELMLKVPEIAMKRDTSIAFDVVVIDDDDVYNWSDLSNSQDISTMFYGTLKLGGSKIAKAKYGTPKVDGEIEDLWNNVEEFTTEIAVVGSINNAKATVRTMWDEQYLYVLATVNDTTLNQSSSNAWEQDSFEIFIDENNNKSESYQDDDAQFRVNFVNEQSFGAGASPDRFMTATKITPNGYIVEAAIKWKTIKPSAGMMIGFDCQVNDANVSGSRTGILKWNDPTDNTWSSMAGVGNLILEN